MHSSRGYRLPNHVCSNSVHSHTTRPQAGSEHLFLQEKSMSLEGLHWRRPHGALIHQLWGVQHTRLQLHAHRLQLRAFKGQGSFGGLTTGGGLIKLCASAPPKLQLNPSLHARTLHSQPSKCVVQPLRVDATDKDHCKAHRSHASNIVKAEWCRGAAHKKRLHSSAGFL